MKLPTVRKFLCCFKLETGGLFLGWISVILGGLTVLLLGLLVILTIISIIYFDDFINDQNNINSNVSNEDLKLALIVAIVVYAIVMVFLIINFIAALQLIRGTKNRNHEQCKFFMILMAIGAILSFIQTISQGWIGLPGAIFGAIISGYFFICIYSMYDMFKQERLQKQTQGAMPQYGQGNVPQYA